MKKIIFVSLALLTAILGIIFVSCEREESKKHHYTEEELKEIARQDSLKQIIPADYVFTQDVTVPLTDDYSGITVSLVTQEYEQKLLDSLGFNSISEIVTALGTLEGGVQVGNDITFFAYNYSTKYEYTSPSTTNYFGHWFDANGDVCNWGDQAYLFLEKQDTFTLNFTLGMFPSRPTVGATYHIVEAMKYDSYKVAFLFNVTIGEEVPLVYPVTTIVGTQTLDVSEDQDNTYAPTPVAINASDIETAIGITPGSAELYGIDASDDSLYIDGFTANTGYWYTGTGDVTNWGTAGCTLFGEYNSTDQVINVGQFPDSAVVGETYTIKMAFVNLDNLKQYNIVINVTITQPAAVYPETTLELTLDLALTVPPNNDYTATSLALDSAAIQAAIGCGPSAAVLYGVDATTDSLNIGGLTANNGCWFNAAGDVCAWGTAGCSIAAEYAPATQTINAFQFPDACVSGTTYYGRLAFVNGDKRAEVKVAMTIE
jgi:hypothetical protein